MTSCFTGRRFLTLVLAVLCCVRSSGQTLTAGTSTIYLLTGGTQTFTLTGGSGLAGKTYLVLGSVSGTAPGFPAGPFTLPLNFDFYFDFTLLNPNTLIVGSLGVLDASGNATAALTLPPGIDPSLAGLVGHHAYGVVDTMTGAILGVSNAVSLTLAAAPPPLVINEVDYDQPGTDTLEFIEIFNPAAYAVPLAGLSLDRMNGAVPASPVSYGSIALSGGGTVLPPGGYLVIGSSLLLGSVPAGTLTIAFTAATNNVQNGNPDGLRIIHTSGAVLDSLAYGGAMNGIGEGAPAPTDTGSSFTEVIARSPNGVDTGNNFADFSHLMQNTPGAANP